VVNPADSGNGFGTRVFWTAVIPDSDFQIDPGAGTAALHVRDLQEVNYYSPSGFAGNISLGPDWQTAGVDSKVSFDVTWNGPVTRRISVKDPTYDFAGTFNELNNNNVTVKWSGSNALGFTFTSDLGNLATSSALLPGFFFAQIAQERNGRFFPGGEPVREAAAPSHSVQQTFTLQQLQPFVRQAIADWHSAGATASQLAQLRQVQVSVQALPASYLGEQAGGQVWISPNAAGWGWNPGDATTAVSPGRMDLHSVLDHEFGHVLGLADSANLQDVMGETLAAGVRRLPRSSDLGSSGLSSPLPIGVLGPGSDAVLGGGPAQPATSPGASAARSSHAVPLVSTPPGPALGVPAYRVRDQVFADLEATLSAAPAATVDPPWTW
jgi:hypothetical protein